MSPVSRSALKSSRREAEKSLNQGDHVAAFVRLSHALKLAEALLATDPEVAGKQTVRHILTFNNNTVRYLLISAAQNIHQILSQRSKCLLKMGSLYLALEDGRRLAEEDPGSAAGHQRMAEVYQSSCHFTRAHDSYLRCFQLSSKKEQDVFMELMKSCKREAAREKAIDEKVNVVVVVLY